MTNLPQKLKEIKERSKNTICHPTFEFHDDILRLVKALERAVEMIEDAIGLDGRSMGWEEEDEHKKRHLKELAEILNGN